MITVAHNGSVRPESVGHAAYHNDEKSTRGASLACYGWFRQRYASRFQLERCLQSPVDLNIQRKCDLGEKTLEITAHAGRLNVKFDSLPPSE